MAGRSPVIVPWDRCRELFDMGADAAEVAAMYAAAPTVPAVPAGKRPDAQPDGKEAE